MQLLPHLQMENYVSPYNVFRALVGNWSDFLVRFHTFAQTRMGSLKRPRDDSKRRDKTVLGVVFFTFSSLSSHPKNGARTEGVPASIREPVGEVLSGRFDRGFMVTIHRG